MYFKIFHFSRFPCFLLCVCANDIKFLQECLCVHLLKTLKFVYVRPALSLVGVSPLYDLIDYLPEVFSGCWREKHD